MRVNKQKIMELLAMGPILTGWPWFHGLLMAPKVQDQPDWP